MLFTLLRSQEFFISFSAQTLLSSLIKPRTRDESCKTKFLTFKEIVDLGNNIFSVTSIRPLSQKRQEIVSVHPRARISDNHVTMNKSEDPELQIKKSPAWGSNWRCFVLSTLVHPCGTAPTSSIFSYISDYLGTDSTLISKWKSPRWKGDNVCCKMPCKNKTHQFWIKLGAHGLYAGRHENIERTARISSSAEIPALTAPILAARQSCQLSTFEFVLQQAC